MLFAVTWIDLEIAIVSEVRQRKTNISGFSGGSDSKETACNARDLGLIAGVGKIPWSRTR